MGNKNKKRSRSSGGGDAGDGNGWTSDVHASRKANQQRKNNKLSVEKLEQRERRSALLTRDSKEKREEGKLRLHIKLLERQIEKLKNRLENWDDVAEKEKKIQQEKEKRKRKELEQQKDENGRPLKRKKGRLGPETWKLKGAARPAWQVYDYDTRYVDPHKKKHEDALKAAARCRNIFTICKGRFGNETDDDVPQPECREYLSLLMQLGNLARSNQLKTARKAFLECIELDSIDRPVTPARCQLMRLYIDANRPECARRFWERLPQNDASVWIRYSAALIEYVSWKILGEKGSTQKSAELLLGRAMKTNVFCAYYLAFFDVFNDVMDCTEEIEDAHESSPLEEAIEYCNSEQLGAWKGTEGALDWVKDTLLRVLRGETIGSENDTLSASHLDWRSRLQSVRKQLASTDHRESTTTISNEGDNSECGSHEEEEQDVDTEMFATMFETAMEMLEVSGDFKL